MKQRFILVSITLLVGVLFLGVVSCGPAPTPAPVLTPTTPSTASPSVAPVASQGRGANGTLAKIDGNTLTLTTAQGSVTVSVDSSTTIQKTVTGSLSDIQEGTYIFASGDQDAKGNITATSIRIQSPVESTRPPPSTTTAQAAPRQRMGTAGTVTKLEGTVLTLNTVQGPVTVNISSDAAIQKTVTGSLSDLREGVLLSVMGSRDASGNIASATSIRIQPADQVAPNSPRSK